jgi:hypothetical protein
MWTQQDRESARALDHAKLRLYERSPPAILAHMDGLDYFTFLVLGVLISAGLALAFLIGSLPGKIAVDRRHPQADAIRVAGWFGLLTLGLLFPVALIWAYTKPSTDSEIERLRSEVGRLGDRVDVLEGRETALAEEESAQP